MYSNQNASVDGPAHEILVLITMPKNLINVHADVC